MDANGVINNWEECLNNYDLEGIVELYSSNAVLWGTFSKVIRDSSELISEYFQNLFEKKELSVNFSSKASRSYENTTIFSGTYEFSYMEDELVIHYARFTFAVCKEDSGCFKIAEHHSSIIP
ncbi:MAG: nuclear transport factor 2 family protein [Pseudomonadota bacterium]